jgi:RNA polymerase sigma-70 factor (ECF subfamily)
LRFVIRCIRQLPPNLRTAAELRLLEEMPYPEAAHQLGISEANLRKRVQQARQILRQRLEDYRNDELPTRPNERLPHRSSEESFHSSKSCSLIQAKPNGSGSRDR